MNIASITAKISTVRPEDVPPDAFVKTISANMVNKFMGFIKLSELPPWAQKVIPILPNLLFTNAVVRIDYEVGESFGTFSGTVYLERI